MCNLQNLIFIALAMMVGLSTGQADDKPPRTIELEELSITVPGDWLYRKRDGQFFMATTRREGFDDRFRELVEITRVPLDREMDIKELFESYRSEVQKRGKLIDSGWIKKNGRQIPWYQVEESSNGDKFIVNSYLFTQYRWAYVLHGVAPKQRADEFESKFNTIAMSVNLNEPAVPPVYTDQPMNAYEMGKYVGRIVGYIMLGVILITGVVFAVIFIKRKSKSAPR